MSYWRKATSYFNFLFVVAGLFLLACSTQQPQENSPRATASPQTTSQLTATPQPNNPSSTVPPLSEVQDAVKRVCVDAVTIDTKQPTPFIVGDFNGDGSEDLVVIVRPANGSLPKLNSEYANWITEDPQKVVLPDPHKAVQQLPKPPPRAMVQANDVLLLVLHGYQQAGWHHQYARQTFLLKNATGENIRAQSFAEVSKIKAGQTRSGEVIAVKLSGRDQFLYWTNGRYAWL